MILTHLLDRTVLDGFSRCEEADVKMLGAFGAAATYRQCVRDAGHTGAHEFGAWRSVPQRLIRQHAYHEMDKVRRI